MMMTSHSGIVTQSAAQSSNGGVHLKIADWLSKEPRPPERTETTSRRIVTWLCLRSKGLSPSTFLPVSLAHV